MTQQEQFEADYLAAFPEFGGELAKYPGSTEYISDEAAFAHAVWLQQAKRHEEELRAKAEVLVMPVASHYLIWFDDADRKPELFSDKSAALKRYEQVSISWNAHLFVLADSNSRDAGTVPAQAVSVPAGWRLVPIHPTQEMLQSGQDVIDSASSCDCGNVHITEPDDIYDAMFAAAPQPEPPC